MANWRPDTENWQPVRWGSKYEDKDAWDLILNDQLAEHFSRALDKAGWMIVPQPEFSSDPWCMDPMVGPVAAWAEPTPTTDA